MGGFNCSVGSTDVADPAQPAMNETKRTISILVPAYNEAGNLPRLHARLVPVMAQLANYQFEVIILDNCSEDETRAVALGLCQADPRLRYVRYSRNFGYHASLACGYDEAQGDAVLVLVGDLQEPPEMLPEMVRQWEAGADVVCGVLRTRNDHTWVKSLGARIAYRLIYWLTDCKIPPDATDFRLVDRQVADALRQMREPDRYLRGLVHWVGFKQAFFPYDRESRSYGQSNWGVWASVKMAMHAILCFSSKPLRLMTYFGLLVTCGAAMLTAVYLGLYWLAPSWVRLPAPGVMTLCVLVLFMIGLNAVFLGVIGEYVGRIYDQGKGRPLYLVAERAPAKNTGT